MTCPRDVRVTPRKQAFGFQSVNWLEHQINFQLAARTERLCSSALFSRAAAGVYAASISLQSQHTAGTYHQPPGFVSAEVDFIILGRLARQLDRIFIFSRR